MTKSFPGLERTACASHRNMQRHLCVGVCPRRDERILQAESPQVFQAYCITDETPQALFFIRPDGYIAYRSKGLATEGLERVLSQVFLHL